MAELLNIAGEDIPAGSRKRVILHTSKLYDFTETNIPIQIIRGKKDGPTLLVSAALHGDEINGVEIIQRLLNHSLMKKLKGTLISVPIVNTYGFNNKSRYLADRRDLNRSFPGFKDGSLTGQIAHTLQNDVLAKATHAIDLHTAAINRRNLPQIRGYFGDEQTKYLSECFGAPVMIDADLREGSLRQAAHDQGIPMLLYEGGEALRFHESVTRIGLKGILNVMREIGMLPKIKSRPANSFYAHASHWIRAPHSGMLQRTKRLGDYVKKDDLLGKISDPFGEHSFDVRAKHDGIIIGKTMLPLVNQGDASFHIATFEDTDLIEDQLEQYQRRLSDEVETYIV